MGWSTLPIDNADEMVGSKIVAIFAELRDAIRERRYMLTESPFWVIDTYYNQYYPIKHSGYCYISKIAHTSSANSEPGTGANWETYWQYSYYNDPPEVSEPEYSCEILLRRFRDYQDCISNIVYHTYRKTGTGVNTKLSNSKAELFTSLFGAGVTDWRYKGDNAFMCLDSINDMRTVLNSVGFVCKGPVYSPEGLKGYEFGIGDGGFELGWSAGVANTYNGHNPNGSYWGGAVNTTAGYLAGPQNPDYGIDNDKEVPTIMIKAKAEYGEDYEWYYGAHDAKVQGNIRMNFNSEKWDEANGMDWQEIWLYFDASQEGNDASGSMEVNVKVQNSAQGSITSENNWRANNQTLALQCIGTDFNMDGISEITLEGEFNAALTAPVALAYGEDETSEPRGWANPANPSGSYEPFDYYIKTFDYSIPHFCGVFILPNYKYHTG